MGHEQRDDGKAKKAVRETTREPNGSIFLLRAAELGFVTDEALSQVTMGMIFDLYTEKANDAEKYPYKATQADINRIFGGG